MLSLYATAKAVTTFNEGFDMSKYYKVLKAFQGDNGRTVYPGAVIELSESRVAQALKDGWIVLAPGGSKPDINGEPAPAADAGNPIGI